MLYVQYPTRSDQRVSRKSKVIDLIAKIRASFVAVQRSLYVHFIANVFVVICSRNILNRFTMRLMGNGRGVNEPILEVSRSNIEFIARNDLLEVWHYKSVSDRACSFSSLHRK